MDHAGEKTEQPTPRKLEDALKKGQFPKSAEVQTVFVLLAALAALSFTGREMWMQMTSLFMRSLGHLHDTPVSAGTLQAYAVQSILFLGRCIGPVLLATVLAGLLAGGIQNKFQVGSEALRVEWERLNPVAGFQRLFSMRQAAPTALASVKLAVIGLISYSAIRSVFDDPIFASGVSLAHVSAFFAQAGLRISLRIGLALGVIAAADYGYQWWQNHQDMMMTKEEVKEEMKSTDGNPQVKAARKRRKTASKATMLADVPKADVIVTNPTHIAIALRYDRKTMKAPKIVAKGIRLNAAQIKEIALRHHIPVLENKPLARMLFKYGKVGGEVPAQLYAAVAEVLAWVYRVNRYRYYAEENQT